jgi:hypothetical protein
MLIVVNGYLDVHSTAIPAGMQYFSPVKLAEKQNTGSR